MAEARSHSSVVSCSPSQTDMAHQHGVWLLSQLFHKLFSPRGSRAAWMWSVCRTWSKVTTTSAMSSVQPRATWGSERQQDMLVPIIYDPI